MIELIVALFLLLHVRPDGRYIVVLSIAAQRQQIYDPTCIFSHNKQFSAEMVLETIPRPSERTILAIWTILTSTLAITGNLVVLIAINRKSVKLDRFSVVFIGHLAVADLGCGLYVITNFINIVAGHYILGEENCSLSVITSLQ